MGRDFNINYQKCRQESTKKLKHFALQHQPIQLITESTRSLQSESIIDLIFSNCSHIQYAGTLPLNLSDYVPVIVNIKKKKTLTKKAEFKGRSYRCFDKNDFLQSLDDKKWLDFDNSPDVDDKLDNLYNNVIETVSEQIPVKTFIFPKSKTEWLVAELVKYMKDRDLLLKKTRQTKLRGDKKAANRARNKTNCMVKNAKKNCIKEILNDYWDNPLEVLGTN